MDTTLSDPEPSPDPNHLITTLITHLSILQSSPDTELNTHLLQRSIQSLSNSTPHPLLLQILSLAEPLLSTLNTDVRPLTLLLSSTINLLSFDELKSAISVEKLIQGLEVGGEGVKLLCLGVVGRAGERPSSAAWVAGQEALVKILMGTWMGGGTEVASKAEDVLVGLLGVDLGGRLTGGAEGQGLMWRRLFMDGEVYGLFYEWSSLVGGRHDLSTKEGRQAVTVSQGRLFDLVVRVAELDWEVITTMVHRDVERRYSRRTGEGGLPCGGLLRYVADGMIDRSDYLMEVLRRDFFAKLLLVIEEEEEGEENDKVVSEELRRAIENGAGVQRTNGSTNGMHL